jgi:5-methylcytosine-specific restriction enzyme subunit McrC
MVPFLIDMAALYEAFLAEWLLQHMPAGFSVHPKQKLRVRGSWAYTLEMDILIKSGQTAEPLYVLDAKYKAPEKPSTDDINQAVTYAEAVGCHRAALVYPTRVGTPLQNQYGRNAVRTLTFPLGGDIEAGGGAFLESWLPELWELLEATERRGA